MKRNNIIIAFIATIASGWALPVSAGSEVSEDTSFRKNNPNLLYTTRDYFVTVPDNCYPGDLCLSDFMLILTFNIGVDSKQQIRQVGFHSADLDLNSKTSSGKMYVPQDFSNYKPVSSMDGWKLNLSFYPDKTTSTVKGAVQKCVFDGTVGQKGVSGKLIFYTATGNFEIAIN